MAMVKDRLILKTKTCRRSAQVQQGTKAPFEGICTKQGCGEIKAKTTYELDDSGPSSASNRGRNGKMMKAATKFSTRNDRPRIKVWSWWQERTIQAEQFREQTRCVWF
jgi:hypothetical protein